jgi:hypothetical protein
MKSASGDAAGCAQPASARMTRTPKVQCIIGLFQLPIRAAGSRLKQHPHRIFALPVRTLRVDATMRHPDFVMIS